MTRKSERIGGTTSSTPSSPTTSNMLAADLAGRPYVKLRHSEALMARVGRTHRSVEFKHQNISAVLDELGLPWIPGYKPKRNYQNAIFGAIERYLTEHPDILQIVPKSPPAPPVPEQVFVSPPALELVHAPVPKFAATPHSEA